MSSLWSSSFLAMIVPWSLYFLRMKCVAVLITVSSVESLLETKLETALSDLPSSVTRRSYPPEIR